MKTQSVHQQPPLICEKQKTFFGLSSSSLQQLFSLLIARTKSLRNLSSMAVLQTYQAGLAAFQSRLRLALNEAWVNRRFRTGVIIGLLAIPAWKSHLFFDIDQRIEGFYYVNYVFYFNTIRPFLSGLFLAIGFFICAPQKWSFKWLALPVAIFCASEIYAESLYTDYTDFYQSMPAWQGTLIGLFCLPALFFSVDYLVYRKYHLKDGTIARMKGIIAAPGISAADKMRLLEDQSLELENFNQRY